jgi:hypothetical protein
MKNITNLPKTSSYEKTEKEEKFISSLKKVEKFMKLII